MAMHKAAPHATMHEAAEHKKVVHKNLASRSKHRLAHAIKSMA